MSRIKVVVSGGIALVVLAASAVGPPAVASATDSFGAYVSGVVTNGATAVVGAPIALFADPIEDTQSDDTTPTAPLQSVLLFQGVTAADGSYAITPDFGQVAQGYVNSDGTVNTQLDVDRAVYGMPIAEPNTPAVTDATDVATPVIPLRANLDLATNTLTTQLGSTSPTTAAAPMATAVAGNAAAASSESGQCSHYSTFMARRAEPWLHLFSRPHARVTVHQTVSSSHAVSIGFASAGEGGGWSISGHTTLETKNSDGRGRSWDHNFTVYNTINVRHYHYTCYDSAGEYTYQTVAMASFHELYTPGARPIGDNSYRYCTQVKTRDTYDKKYGANLTFAGAIQVGPVDLSANAKYSKQTEVSWVGTATGIDNMCGSNTTFLHADAVGIRAIGGSGGGCGVNAGYGVKPDPNC